MNSFQGPRLEEQPCSEKPPCPFFGSKGDHGHHHHRTSSNRVISGEHVFTLDNRDPDFLSWNPAFSDDTISPCSCGCIYIVGRQRRIGITSAKDCSASPHPLRWKVKVRKEREKAT